MSAHSKTAVAPLNQPRQLLPVFVVMLVFGILRNLPAFTPLQYSNCGVRSNKSRAFMPTHGEAG